MAGGRERANGFFSLIRPIRHLFPSFRKSNSSAEKSEITGNFCQSCKSCQKQGVIVSCGIKLRFRDY